MIIVVMRSSTSTGRPAEETPHGARVRKVEKEHRLRWATGGNCTVRDTLKQAKM